MLAWVAVAGSLALGILAYMLWRTGRMPGLHTLPAAPGAIAVYEGSFPTGGADPLISPRGIAVDEDRVYVVEPDAARISVFALDGRLVTRLAIEATGTVYPTELAVHEGRLYVVDAAGSRVLVMPTRGGAARPLAAELVRPTVIAQNGAELLVGDAERGVLRIDLKSGRAVSAASDARFFIGGLAPAPDGRLAVSDATGSRLWMVDAKTGALTAFGERVNLPRGLAVDGAGRVWAADVLGGTVSVFDRTGHRLGDLASESIVGPDSPRLVAPEGVVYVEEVKRLYVTDARLGRVFAFGIRR